METWQKPPISFPLCIKAVVVNGQSTLGDVESSGGTSFAHVYPHIHRSHNPRYFARCFAIQSFSNRRKHVGPGIFKIWYAMGIALLSAIPDDLFQSLPLGFNHFFDGLLAIDKWSFRTYLHKFRHHMQPFRALVLYTVLPQDILCLMRDMPQTALDDYLDLIFLNHPEWMYRRLWSKETGGEIPWIPQYYSEKAGSMRRCNSRCQGPPPIRRRPSYTGWILSVPFRVLQSP